jgi:transcriptional regulator of heat shock response
MKNFLRIGTIAFAAMLMFISVETASAQSQRAIIEARRELNRDYAEAQRDYNRRIRNGDYRNAARELREDRREALREYNQRLRNARNRGVVNNRRVYYRNGRVVRTTRNW